MNTWKLPLIVLTLCGLAACSTAGSQPPVAINHVHSAPTPVATPVSMTAAAPAPGLGGPAAASTITRCDMPSLTIAFKSQNAAMGGLRADTFVMTNTGRSTCTIYGYVGMQMLGPSADAMPTNVVRSGPDISAVNPGPSLVTLQPGGSASFQAAWREWFGAGTSCQPASKLEITPPDAYDYVTMPVTWGLAPCYSGRIDVTAVAPGTGT